MGGGLGAFVDWGVEGGADTLAFSAVLSIIGVATGFASAASFGPSLGTGDRDLIEDAADIVAAAAASATLFFFLRFLGGRFFFSGSTGAGGSSPILLDAHSDTDSPSSSSEFQYCSISFWSRSGSKKSSWMKENPRKFFESTRRATKLSRLSSTTDRGRGIVVNLQRAM